MTASKFTTTPSPIEVVEKVNAVIDDVAGKLSSTGTAAKATADASGNNIVNTYATKTEVNAKASLASPSFTGTPKAPTASAGTNTTQIATTAFVTNALSKAAGFDSYWSAGEKVNVGDIRMPSGRANSGVFLECVQAGTTGSTQPVIDKTVLADFSDVGRIGQVRWIYNIAEKDDDEIFATGVKYSRATYSALWSYVQSKPALLISESEWQAKYTATGGKFVPYFSSGNGSTDFRTPLLAAYATGSADNSKIGTFTEAGLPNITGTFNTDGYNNRFSGAFTFTSGVTGASGDGDGGYGNFDASKSNPIYGNSETVTPDTMNGVWVIKAFGLIVNAENTDVKGVLNGINNVSSRVSTIESTYIHVIESYVSGTSWYRVWSDGWIEQGGQFTSPSSPSYPTYTGTFLKPFTSIPVRVVRTPMGFDTGDAGSYLLTVEEITTTGFYIRRTYATQTYSWYACGR